MAELLTDPVRILDLLRRLHRQRSLLTVRIPGIEQRFLSAIIKKPVAGQPLALDELVPETGHKHMVRGIDLRIEARLAGVEIRFPTRLEDVAEEDGHALYSASFPDTVDHYQRRASFRVKVGMGIGARCQFIIDTSDSEHDDDSETLTGDIVDMSVEGIGARLPHSDILHTLGTYDVELRLPEGRIQAELEVRFVDARDDAHNMRVGARFKNLEPLAKRQIQRFVADMQREMIKKDLRKPQTLT